MHPRPESLRIRRHNTKTLRRESLLATQREELLDQLKRLKEELLQLYVHLKGDDEADSLTNVERVQDCERIIGEIFSLCKRVPISKLWQAWLRETVIAKVLAKLSKLDSARFPSLVEKATILIMIFKALAGVMHKQGQALEEYRALVRELEKSHQAKPDMIAFSRLRKKYDWLCRRKHGHLENIPVGLVVSGRGEAAFLGIHSKILCGIDGIKDAACFAICLAGKYDDDEGRDNPDGKIIYTGAGGQDKKGRQVKDQTDTPENVSLIESRVTGTPVRVIRKLDGIRYRYEGLYRCVDYVYVPSEEGPKVYKFILKPIPYESTHCFKKLYRLPHGRGMIVSRRFIE